MAATGDRKVPASTDLINSSGDSDASVLHKSRDQFFTQLCFQNAKKNIVKKAASFNSRIPVSSLRTKQKNIPEVSTDLGSDGGTPPVCSSHNSTSSGSPEDFFTPSSTLSGMKPSLIPILELPLDGPNIDDIIKGFPTTITIHSSIDWSDTKASMNLTMDEQIEQALHTARLLAQVRQVFNTNGDVLEDTKHTIPSKSRTSIFLSNHFKHELWKETRYSNVFQKIDLCPNGVILRKKRVEWIVNAGIYFELNLETVYLALFYVDSFTRSHTIDSQEESNIIAVAALRIACKMEEGVTILSKHILQNYKSMNFTKRQILKKEGKILSDLQFQISPPSAQLIIDLVLESGFLDLENSSMKRYVKGLALDLLLGSFQDIAFFHIKASIKARLALEVAVEYIMYHWNIYRQMEYTDQSNVDHYKAHRATSFCELTYHELLYLSVA